MEFIEKLLTTLQEFAEWFITTELPKDTSYTFAEIIQFAGNALSILLDKYLLVFFG